MGWHSFSPTEKELTSNILNTRLKYELLGDKIITAHCIKTVSFQGVEKTIDCSAQKEITIQAPNLMSYDGLFICSYDGKFIDVMEGE